MWTNLRSLLKALSHAALAKVFQDRFLSLGVMPAPVRETEEKKIDKVLWNCCTALIPGGVGRCLCIKAMQRGGMYEVMCSQYPYRCQVTPLNREYTVPIICTDLENCCHFTIASDESRDIQDQPQLAAFFLHSESEEEYYLKYSEGRVAGHSCPWGTRHVGPFSKRLYWWLLEEATHWINKSKKIAMKLFIAWPQSHWYLRYFCEFCLCSSLNWSCFCCGFLSCSRQWCPQYILHH